MVYLQKETEKFQRPFNLDYRLILSLYIAILFLYSLALYSRITSPFNKRKIKELNNPKQLLQQQPQLQPQPQPQPQPQQQHVSNIPTPKKYTGSNLPHLFTDATSSKASTASKKAKQLFGLALNESTASGSKYEILIQICRICLFMNA